MAAEDVDRMLRERLFGDKVPRDKHFLISIASGNWREQGWEYRVHCIECGAKWYRPTYDDAGIARDQHKKNIDLPVPDEEDEDEWLIVVD